MTTKTFQFSNGDEVVETITGFKGTITGSVYYLTGCNQYLVVSKSKDEFSEGKALWYDEGRLKLVKSEAFKPADVQGEDNGCDLLPSIGMRGA
jgi:hypothetical protein